MLLRVIVVAIVLLVAFGSVRVAGRRTGRVSGIVPPGLTLVVGKDCYTCVRAIAALDATGTGYEIVDVAAADAYGVPSFSVPYAIVGDLNGRVVAVRRGIAVIQDASELATLTAA